MSVSTEKYNSLLYLKVIQYNENCTPSFLAETLNVARSAVTSLSSKNQPRIL